MTKLNFKNFMKKYNLRKATMNESYLQRVYNCKIYPRDTKVYSDKGFVNIDSGNLGGTHRVCLY